MVNKFSLLIAGLFLFGCSTNKFPVDYKAFTINSKNKLNVTDSILRHDGVYYRYYVGRIGDFGASDNKVDVLIFFSDGIFAITGGDKNSLNADDAPCVELSDRVRNIPYFWGLYEVRKDTLFIEQVHSKRGLFSKFSVEKKVAVISENGAIRFVKKILPGGRVVEMNTQYSFLHCDSLPNSKNKFKFRDR